MLSNVLDIRGCRAISFTATTEPCLKKGHPFGNRLRKTSYVSGMIGWVYENAVNNQRNREGRPIDPLTGEVEHFTADARKWGMRYRRPDGSLSPFVHHKGEQYLEVKVQKSLRHFYHLENGQPIGAKGRKIVREFLAKKEEGKRQKVERPVILRDYNLKNIREVTINGETHTA